jgi:hypothetical protein
VSNTEVSAAELRQLESVPVELLDGVEKRLVLPGFVPRR